MKYLVGIALAVALVVGALRSEAEMQEDEIFDLLMSDMPLKSSEVPEDWTKGGRQSKKAQDFGLGDHQANDLGPVHLLTVERCNGVPI